MRVFLDANVLFSASNGGSNIARLIALLTERETGVTSDVAAEEARRNLALKRDAWRPALEILLEDLEIVPSALFHLPVSLDTAETSLLCAAIRSRCVYFVTGDRRDFGHLYGETVHGVENVSLLRLADVLSRGLGTSIGRAK